MHTVQNEKLKNDREKYQYFDSSITQSCVFHEKTR